MDLNNSSSASKNSFMSWKYFAGGCILYITLLLATNAVDYLFFEKGFFANASLTLFSGYAGIMLLFAISYMFILKTRKQ